MPQAQAFFARQAAWLEAKQEHSHNERERHLRSLRRRSASAKAKGVSPTAAEAFFANELACKRRREEGLAKLREEARVRREAELAAGEGRGA